jgi:hypothetical protein
MDPNAEKAILQARKLSATLRSTRVARRPISQRHRELKQGFFKRRQFLFMSSSFKNSYGSLRAAIEAEAAEAAHLAASRAMSESTRVS